MARDNELMKERATAILLWGLPWGIVVVFFVAFRDELKINSFTESGAIYVLIFVVFCYIVSSVCSFVGFVLPHFCDNKGNEPIKLKKPSPAGVYSDSALKLINSFKKDKKTERLYASCIVIHDFLLDYKERGIVKNLSCYIPSVLQLKQYPYESLCMMLSSQDKFEGAETDKYYNFEQVLRTCLLDAE